MMNATQRRWACALLCLVLFLAMVPAAQADDGMAEEISSKKMLIDYGGFGYTQSLFDKKLTVSLTIPGGSHMTFQHEKGIGSAYLIFNAPPAPYTVTNEDNGETVTFGQNGFLHDFLDLEAAFGIAPNTITFRFDSEIQLNEFQFFTSGQTPDTVHKWELPKEGKVDLMLFSTHCDDDQLFFAGVLPYYAAELDYEVLVVYLTCHREKDPHRQHEALNGLWAVGVRTYPVLGEFADHFCSNMVRSYALHESKGDTKEEMLGYVVEQMRRYKPLVAIGHDLIKGEYGHGQHMMYADLLCQALDVAPDAEQYPELAEKYGTWEVQKTYLHLWKENQIVMDWDVPLESFDGMTAFEVTQQLGYPCHESQYQDFAWYLARVPTAAGVKKYNPRFYGLYRTTVGDDVEKNDFFENVVTHTELDRIAEEERLAAEEEARRQEEAARLEEEKRKAEEAARLEEQKRLEEEARREEEARQESIAAAEAAKQAEEAAARQTRLLLIVMGVCLALVVVLTLILVKRLKKQRRR